MMLSLTPDFRSHGMNGGLDIPSHQVEETGSSMIHGTNLVAFLIFYAPVVTIHLGDACLSGEDKRIGGMR